MCRTPLIPMILVVLALLSMFSIQTAIAQNVPSQPQTVGGEALKAAVNEVVIFQDRKRRPVKRGLGERVNYREMNRQSFLTGFMRRLYSTGGINMEESHIVNFSVMARLDRRKRVFLELKEIDGRLITGKKIKLEFPYTMGNYKKYSIDIHDEIDYQIAEFLMAEALGGTDNVC